VSSGDKPRRPTLHTLTSLRWVAALAVFAFHTSPFFVGTSWQTAVGYLTLAGPAGVSFFFILSGFVLTWSRRDGDRRRDFYRRRFARIYPLHLVTWAAAGVLLVSLGFELHAAGVALSAVLLQAWVPDPNVYYAMDAPSWSLSCEAFFYLVFPFGLVVLLRANPLHRRLAAAGLLVAALVLPALGGAAEFFPPARLAEFLLGVVLALEVEAGTLRRVPLVPVAALTAGVFVLTGVIGEPRLRVTLLVVPFLLLIAAAAHAELDDRSTARNLAAPWLVRLGQWSFAFYLVHGLVFVAMVHLEGQHRLGVGGAVAWTAVTFATSLLLSGLAFTWLERPLERRLRPDHRVPPPLRDLPAGPDLELVPPALPLAGELPL
jgi:peptidoglycan/LPS O-acetylase OafA/YrhL